MIIQATSDQIFNGNIIYVNKKDQNSSHRFYRRIGENARQKLREMIKYKDFSLFIFQNDFDTYGITAGKSFLEITQKKSSLISKEKLSEIINFAKKIIVNYTPDKYGI